VWHLDSDFQACVAILYEAFFDFSTKRTSERACKYTKAGGCCATCGSVVLVLSVLVSEVCVAQWVLLCGIVGVIMCMVARGCAWLRVVVHGCVRDLMVVWRMVAMAICVPGRGLARLR